MRVPARLLCAGFVLISRTASHGHAQGPSLFVNSEVLEFRLETPLQKLFAAKADDTFTVAGTLTLTGSGGDATVIKDVEVSVRSHTSRRDDECTFPQLKLKFTDARAAAGSVFELTRSVKLGTHCGELPDGQLAPKFGRLANEHSPLRETFVYRLLAEMGIPTLRARPARVTYVDSGMPSATPLVRYAVVLEDDDDARARLGGNAEIPVQQFGTAADRFSAADTARIAFAEAMIGNFDWCLKLTADDRYRCDAATPLWNVAALQQVEGRR